MAGGNSDTIIGLLEQVVNLLQNGHCPDNEIENIAKLLGKEHNRYLDEILGMMAVNAENNKFDNTMFTDLTDEGKQKEQAKRKHAFLKAAAKLSQNTGVNLFKNKTNNRKFDEDNEKFLKGYWGGEDSPIFKILKDIFEALNNLFGSMPSFPDTEFKPMLQEKLDYIKTNEFTTEIYVFFQNEIPEYWHGENDVDKINSAIFMLMGTIYTIMYSYEYFYENPGGPINIITIIENSTIPSSYSTNPSGEEWSLDARMNSAEDIYNNAITRAGPGWLITDGEAAAVGFTCVGFLGPATPAGCVGVCVGAGLSSGWQALKDWW